MRILVTGASGLVGLNLALEASQQHTVFGTVNAHRLQTTAFTVLQADLLAPGSVERVLDETRPDWVIHCAALANVDACEAYPALAVKLNSELPGELAYYAARAGARLVHISTDAVFDGERGEYTEQDQPNPLSIYARTKLEGERAVREANSGAIVARVNLFGWDEHLISPASVFDAGLRAARSPKLILNVDKLTRDLGESPPGFSGGLA